MGNATSATRRARHGDDAQTKRRLSAGGAQALELLRGGEVLGASASGGRDWQSEVAGAGASDAFDAAGATATRAAAGNANGRCSLAKTSQWSWPSASSGAPDEPFARPPSSGTWSAPACSESKASSTRSPCSSQIACGTTRKCAICPSELATSSRATHTASQRNAADVALRPRCCLRCCPGTIGRTSNTAPSAVKRALSQIQRQLRFRRKYLFCTPSPVHSGFRPCHRGPRLPGNRRSTLRENALRARRHKYRSGTD